MPLERSHAFRGFTSSHFTFSVRVLVMFTTLSWNIHTFILYVYWVTRIFFLPNSWNPDDYLKKPDSCLYILSANLTSWPRPLFLLLIQAALQPSPPALHCDESQSLDIISHFEVPAHFLVNPNDSQNANNAVLFLSLFFLFFLSFSFN